MPLHSEARRKLLDYFFSHQDAKHYLREIATLLALDPGNLSRELRRLEKEGLFLSKKRGNQKCFFLNPSYEHYSDIKRFFVSSSGDETKAAG
jgi:predicted transcriptional regulator with HTH domain